MSDIATTVIGPNSYRLWERAVSWIVLAFSIAGIAFPAFYISSNWALVQELYYTGQLNFLPFLFPLLFLAAAILLVVRSKWCFLLFILHFVSSLTYVVIEYGLAQLPWYGHLNYMFEVALLYFCFSLMARNAFK